VLYHGRLFVTTAHNTYAIDATSCRKIWEHDYVPDGPEGLHVNRGAALYAGKLFRGTPDGHLLALDAANGALFWDVWICDSRRGCNVSAAPVALDGKVYVGEGGADRGSTGHIRAFDAETGKLAWTFNAIPTAKEPGAETWATNNAIGGGSSWSTITVDPEKHLLYAPLGNPGSDIDGSGRPGANLYSDSVVVLHTDTGRLAWYAQQVPHDLRDWDTAAAPTLYDLDGKSYMAVPNKGGYLYLYDHKTRRLIARQETATHLNIDLPPDANGVHVCPGTLGGTEWNGAAFDPVNRLIFVDTVDWCVTLTVRPSPGSAFGGSLKFDPPDTAKGWIRAFDAVTGEPRWSYHSDTPMVAGLTPTAGGLLFSGDLNGTLLGFEAATGKLIYRFNTGGAIAGGVSSYAIGGRQYLAVASGNSSKTIWSTKGAPTVIVFGLP
jgi:PQQ-dependent dehydrogenase (methanol/ethanol family)